MDLKWQKVLKSAGKPNVQTCPCFCFRSSTKDSLNQHPQKTSTLTQKSAGLPQTVSPVDSFSPEFLHKTSTLWKLRNEFSNDFRRQERAEEMRMFKIETGGYRRPVMSGLTQAGLIVSSAELGLLHYGSGSIHYA